MKYYLTKKSVDESQKYCELMMPKTQRDPTWGVGGGGNMGNGTTVVVVGYVCQCFGTLSWTLKIAVIYCELYFKEDR